MDIFKLVGSIFIDTDEANNSIKKTSENTDAFSEKLTSGIAKAGKWAIGVTAAAGSAATALGVKAVGAASNFEDAFAQVNTLLSDQTDLDNYKQSIIDLSNQLGVSTEEISSAVYSAISAGVDEANAVAFVADSMKLASGGFTDVTTAVDVLTTAINAYGLESEDATKVADMLITTQNLGKTTVDELASSMGKVIPTANAFGVELDDLSAMYAVMTSNGIATADSTTLINAMLNELGKTGSKSDKILRQMTGHIKEGGLSFSEMMEQGWELTDVLSLLDEHASETGVSMMDLFSSSQAAKGAQTLWTNGEKLNEVVMAMGESAGSTEQAFDTMHNTFSTKLQMIGNTLQNVVIMLGEALLPVVNIVVEKIQEYLPQIIGFVEKLTPIITAMFEELLPPLLELAEELFPVIVDLFTELIPLFSDIISQILPVVIELLKAVTPILTEVAKAILPAITEIIQVLTPVFTQLTERLLPIFVNLIEALLPVLNPLLQLLSPILNLFMALLEPLIKLIEIILPPLTDFVVRFINTAMKPLQSVLELCTSWFKTWGESLVSVVTGVLKLVKNPINMILSFINTLINGVTSGVNGIIRALNKLNIKVPDWVSKLTGMTSFGFNLPEVSPFQIPLLAKGGEVEGGSAIVGEDGAELVQLNGNRARVTPLNDNNNAFVGLEQKLDRLIELMEKGFGVYINGNALIGQVAPDIDKTLGKMANKGARYA